MPQSPPDLVQHTLELFAPLGSVRAKRMFGGWGFFMDDLMFALEAWDTIYLKADADSEAPFIDAGCQRFSMEKSDGSRFSMGYWTAPEGALDSPAAMTPWARRAIDCALCNRKTRPQRRS